MKNELRLFLSVDVSGSTALKDKSNHQTLLLAFKRRSKLVQALADELRAASVPVGDALRALDEVALAGLSEENVHWARTIEGIFGDFHGMFLTELERAPGEGEIAPTERYPWKALGDELIYSFEVKSREQLSRIVVAFLVALRRNDKSLLEKQEKGRLRLKGTGWVAGFPVRNRVVTLPMPALHLKDGDRYIEFPFPRTDFVGPDMDIGFRLGKHSFPGLITLSMELAELLASDRVKRRAITSYRVGWEKLKGVWEDRPYPIIWATLRDGHVQDFFYDNLRPGDEAESPFVASWRRAKHDASNPGEEIRAIRASLPASLGVVEPYIPEEHDPVNPVHVEILQLLERLPRGVQGEQEGQTCAEGEPGAVTAAQVTATLETLRAGAGAAAPPADAAP